MWRLPRSLSQGSPNTTAAAGQATDLRLELLLQPYTGVQVQVIGGLVQQQHEGLDEQGPGGIQRHTQDSNFIVCSISNGNLFLFHSLRFRLGKTLSLCSMNGTVTDDLYWYCVGIELRVQTA